MIEPTNMAIGEHLVSNLEKYLESNLVNNLESNLVSNLRHEHVVSGLVGL